MGSPAAAAHALPSIPPTDVSMRLGSFNVGRGFLRKLPRILSRCSELELEVVALQEIGDPAMRSTVVNPYSLVYSAGPSDQEAGVGLLLSLTLLPRIRQYLRSATGRLVGAVLELSAGHRMLLVSAYMPSGLDHLPADSPQHQLAHKLYQELLQWSVGMDQVVVMGDLNETLTRFDRFPLPPPLSVAAVAAASSPIQCLQADGFIDAYRVLHHVDPYQRIPGFTHVIDGVRASCSRIDYIWTKGFSLESHLKVTIDLSMRSLSHHRLLWVKLRLQHAPAAPCNTPLMRLRLPNLRAATEDHKKMFVSKVEQTVQSSLPELDALAHADDTDVLDHLASSLTALVHRAAFSSFPITGAAPYKSNNILQLQHQRRDVARLLHIAEKTLLRGAPFVRCPEWLHQHQRCLELHGLRWDNDPWAGDDPQAWLKETREMMSSTRAAIRKEQHRMLKSQRPPIDANPAAAIHSMLKSDALPSQIHSVVDSHGKLTSSAEGLQRVMVDHFRQVFSKPAEPIPLPRPGPPPAMLLEKPNVMPAWFDGLMAPMKQPELLDALSSSKLVSSPGEDEVCTGLWKMALHGCPSLGKLVCALFSACLRLSFFPSAWKTSVIVPLVKDEKKERMMNNVRPISLQSCLGKLFMLVLALRLGEILARHPILHTAQRGFIRGSSITKCIDELLDAWEHGRAHNSELYTLFYDIMQAYDCVQADVLARALRRLRMPASFILLITNSLSGLSSRIRTAYGMSAPFPVERSLRQGDPLAPLLFVLLLDALHEGLERNPFNGQEHGLVLKMRNGGSASIPSLGYADDTAVLANSLPSLRIQNDWVHYFMAFNQMRLNPSKCELVGWSGWIVCDSGCFDCCRYHHPWQSSRACAARQVYPLSRCLLLL